MVGGARSVPDRAAHSNSERAAPSACVGKAVFGSQIVWNKIDSLRRGAGRQAQMSKDSDNRDNHCTGGWFERLLGYFRDRFRAFSIEFDSPDRV